MSLQINRNYEPLLVQRNLDHHSDSLKKSMMRLSSGLKITNAGDDPIGKADLYRLSSTKKVLDRGIHNVERAFNVVQTAEAGVSKIGEILIRMKQLAEESATETYSDNQRIILQSEFDSLSLEVDRIANTTDYINVPLINGKVSTSSTFTSKTGWYKSDLDSVNSGIRNLTHGHFTKNENLKIHFGKNNYRTEDYYYIKLGNSTMNGLFNEFLDTSDPNQDNATEVVSIATLDSAGTALEQIDSALQVKNRIQANLGSAQNRLEMTLKHKLDEKNLLIEDESLINDMDVAEEMTNFVRLQTLNQTSIAILAQANSIPGRVLKLLA